MTTTTVRLQPVLPASGAFLTFDLVGDDQLSGGTGVWSAIDRPRREAAVEFTGVAGLTYVLPLLLDGMETSPGRDTSVESRCRTLFSWSSLVRSKTKQPVVIKATGPLQTSDTVRWVISNLEWGAKTRNGKGERVQQYVTVTLTQYRAANVRRSTAKRSRDRQGT